MRDYIKNFLNNRIEEEEKIFNSDFEINWEFFTFLIIIGVAIIIIGNLIV